VSLDTSIGDRDVEASRRLAEAFDPSVIDALLADAQATGTPIDGVDLSYSRQMFDHGFGGVGTRKGVPGLGQCGLTRSA
jgi:hypothetical protein